MSGAEPIKDVNDSEVKFAAGEAVKIHNDKKDDDLVFIRVVNGVKQQVDYGKQYSLLIEARNGDGTHWGYCAKIKLLRKPVSHHDPYPHSYVLISWEDPLKFYD
ncbi:Cystatin Hv-CPI6 [Cucumis melo var. makuwa]|uniref:Cystatin Hv-CPI6 n=2 Tax=Cucumis melo TaxID=3656 RepID=A0A5A7SX36_CUCMM|nr:Cystatin Hv-CPI6 [Cucumis melo var. makuwa]TYK21868.1 Cystatin Hv-CPI6 [Cucumis melo var. makuwa]